MSKEHELKLTLWKWLLIILLSPILLVVGVAVVLTALLIAPYPPPRATRTMSDED